MWTLLFCTIAGAGLYASLGPAAGDDAPKGTAIFLAALFVPMGLGPVPFAFMGRRKGERAASATAFGAVTSIADARATPVAIADARATPAAVASDPITMATATPTAEEASAVAAARDESDPLAKIEKLGELRDKGLITEAEFQMQKQRLLREV